MTIASIDIGSNTVLLLIAEADIPSRKIIPVLNVYRMPRLGKELKPGGKISGEKIELFFSILKEYKKIIEQHNCDKTLLTATNAFRLAANAGEIVRLVKKKFGYDIKVISGDEEAEYAFLGALSAFDDNKIKSLVIDIGGGSTELISGNEDEIEFRKSFPTGSVNATEQFLLNKPPKKEELENLDKFLTGTFEEVSGILAPQRTIAIAGTPTTISCMLQNLKFYIEEKVEGSVIEINALKELTGKLKTLTPPEIKNKYGKIMKGREDIILAGAYILLKIMEILKFDKVLVSSRGIRHGAVVHYLKNGLS